MKRKATKYEYTVTSEELLEAVDPKKGDGRRSISAPAEVPTRFLLTCSSGIPDLPCQEDDKKYVYDDALTQHVQLTQRDMREKLKNCGAISSTDEKLAFNNGFWEKDHDWMRDVSDKLGVLSTHKLAICKPAGNKRDKDIRQYFIDDLSNWMKGNISRFYHGPSVDDERIDLAIADALRTAESGKCTLRDVVANVVHKLIAAPTTPDESSAPTRRSQANTDTAPELWMNYKSLTTSKGDVTAEVMEKIFPRDAVALHSLLIEWRGDLSATDQQTLASKVALWIHDSQRKPEEGLVWISQKDLRMNNDADKRKLTAFWKLVKDNYSSSDGTVGNGPPPTHHGDASPDVPEPLSSAHNPDNSEPLSPAHDHVYDDDVKTPRCVAVMGGSVSNATLFLTSDIVDPYALTTTPVCIMPPLEAISHQIHQALATSLLLGILYAAAKTTCHDGRILYVCIPPTLQRTAAEQVIKALDVAPRERFTSDYMQVYDVGQKKPRCIVKFGIAPYSGARDDVKTRHGENYIIYKDTVLSHLRNCMMKHAKTNHCGIKFGTDFWCHDPWVHGNFICDDIATKIGRIVGVNDEDKITQISTVLFAPSRLFVTCKYYGPDEAR